MRGAAEAGATDWLALNGIQPGGSTRPATSACWRKHSLFGLQPRGEPGRGKLLLHFGGDIGNAAIGKLLADDVQAGKVHKYIVLTIR